jgi:hypothetical protein
MKRILTAAAALAALATAAPSLALEPGDPSNTQPPPRIIEQAPPDAAQGIPDASGETTGAINRPSLEPGSNSFTENQARERIKGAGYSDIGPLTLDEQGIWRGTATRGATNVRVGVDFKGNVRAELSTAQ